MISLLNFGILRTGGRVSHWCSVHAQLVQSRSYAESCLHLCVDSMVGSAKVTQAFRKLVALVARAFYAGEYPPKTLEEIAATSSSRTKQQVEQGHTTLPSVRSRVHVGNSIVESCTQGPIHGLVILLLDALCGKDKDDRPVEWIKEEVLAESLYLHIKLVRKTLRFLEQVLLQAAALQSCLQVS